MWCVYYRWWANGERSETFCRTLDTADAATAFVNLMVEVGAEDVICLPTFEAA